MENIKLFVLFYYINKLCCVLYWIKLIVIYLGFICILIYILEWDMIYCILGFFKYVILFRKMNKGLYIFGDFGVSFIWEVW